jgi:hypothetical protein
MIVGSLLFPRGNVGASIRGPRVGSSVFASSKPFDARYSNVADLLQVPAFRMASDHPNALLRLPGRS